ncbi:MAG TPA: hypothetical protein VM431_11085 [Phycisphaerae bacterium]|nr:hypothetical protein [Phycisphaerae bacterium]
MSKSTLLRLALAVVLATLLPDVVRAYSGGWGGSGVPLDTWDTDDQESASKRRGERLLAESKAGATALDAVEAEEAKIMETLQKAISEAAEKSKGDTAREQRLCMLARSKAVSQLEGVGKKYGRVHTACAKLAAEKGMPEDGVKELSAPMVKAKGLYRVNRERAAGLYEELGKFRRALSMYETILTGVPEAERSSETTLKGKIGELKDKLGVKRDDAKTAAAN